MTNAPHRLLIVDDESEICKLIERTARELQIECMSITDPTGFAEALRSFAPSCLIIDLKMPGHDGVELMQVMRDAECCAHVVVMSGMDRRSLNAALKLGRSHGLKMLGVLQKPLHRVDLKSMLNDAMSRGKRYSQDELENAMARRELIVQYQPKIFREERQWKIGGAEALVRWQHPAYGLVMPDEFLPAIESAGLMGRMTDYVIETCVRQISDWIERGIELHVAVNITARLVEDEEFPNRLQRLFEHHGVPGSMLRLELTESAAMANMTQAMDVFLRLRLGGVGLSIDDFGTGFSSLRQLYELPFDELKIDKRFVGELPGDDEARAIVRATVDMAHALSMTVCAEGVETREALEYLDSVGCDRAQGFLISRAVSPVEVEQLIGPWSRQTLRTTQASATT